MFSLSVFEASYVRIVISKPVSYSSFFALRSDRTQAYFWSSEQIGIYDTFLEYG